MSKKISLGSKARDKIGDGLNELSNAVKVTLGPRGRNVAIENGLRIPIITKDGVTVARSISFSDREKNMGAQIIKSVASNANMVSGDGTTTAIVLAQSIYNQGVKKINLGFNPVLIKRGLDKACEIVCKYLDNMSIDISSEDDVRSVAIISTNNDEKLGSLISDVISNIGEDGSVSVINGGGYATSVSYSNGFVIDKGYLSHTFINNESKLRCEFENPYVLLYDGVLSNSNDVVPIMQKVSETTRPLFIIARGIESEAFQTLVLNNLRGTLKSCVIKAPGFGDIRRDMMGDIGIYISAKLFSSDSLEELLNIDLNDLGTCERIICHQNKTVIIGSSTNQEDIDERVVSLKHMLENVNEFDLYDHQVSSIVDRLSKLSGVVATVKVGGLTEAEQREKRDRVEDSINAVRAAIEEGIVAGGGSALLHCIEHLSDSLEESSLMSEEKIGFEILLEVLKAPFIQIMKNSGQDYHLIMQNIISSNDAKLGFDALNLNIENDMFASGIIDPVKVVKSSLSYAVSACGVLLTTEAVIFDESMPDKS